MTGTLLFRNTCTGRLCNPFDFDDDRRALGAASASAYLFPAQCAPGLDYNPTSFTCTVMPRLSLSLEAGGMALTAVDPAATEHAVLTALGELLGVFPPFAYAIGPACPPAPPSAFTVQAVLVLALPEALQAELLGQGGGLVAAAAAAVSATVLLELGLLTPVTLLCTAVTPGAGAVALALNITAGSAGTANQLVALLAVAGGDWATAAQATISPLIAGLLQSSITLQISAALLPLASAASPITLLQLRLAAAAPAAYPATPPLAVLPVPDTAAAAAGGSGAASPALGPGPTAGIALACVAVAAAVFLGVMRQRRAGAAREASATSAQPAAAQPAAGVELREAVGLPVAAAATAAGSSELRHRATKSGAPPTPTHAA